MNAIFKFSNFLIFGIISLLFWGCQEDVNVTEDNKREPSSEKFILKERNDLQISSNQQQIISSQEEFDLNSFERILEKEQGNFVYSPLSLSMLLSMTANGLDTSAKEEIAGVLGIDSKNIEELNSLNKLLTEQLMDVDNSSKIGFFNAGWCDNSYKFNMDYSDKMKAFYDAIFKSVDFSSPLTLNEINEWFKDKTNGLIPKLYDKMPNSPLILSNTSYFKGSWTLPFNKSLTEKSEFKNENGSVSMVDMMKLDGGPLFYFHSNECDMVKLPFGNEAFAAYFVMPGDNWTFEAFRELLSMANRKAVNIPNNLNTLYYFDNNLEVNLPRFNINCCFASLNDVIKASGITRLFESPITGILDSEVAGNMVIQQNTAFSIDEEGAEGASISNEIIQGFDFSGILSTPQISFDHPFLFMIEERSTGAILFLGAVRGL